MMHAVEGPASLFLWFLAEWSLRWALLIALVGLGLTLARPPRTQARMVMLWAVLLAGLALPLVPHWGPGLPPKPLAGTEQGVPQQLGGSNTTEQSDDVPTVSVALASRGRPPDAHGEPITYPSQVMEEASTPSSPVRWESRAAVVLTGLWLCGVAFLAARLVFGLARLRVLKRSATPLAGGPGQLLEQLKQEVRLRRPVMLATHPAVQSPLVLGLGRPLILVPEAWVDEAALVQRATLVHELVHLRHYDDWSALLLETVRILFFFHPLVRWLLSRLEWERELRCDEAAISQGVAAQEYVRMLLQYSRRHRLDADGIYEGLKQIHFGKRRSVQTRIHYLLEGSMSRANTKWIRIGSLFLASALLIVGLTVASVRIRADEQRAARKDENTHTDAPPEQARVTPRTVRENLMQEELAAAQKDLIETRRELRRIRLEKVLLESKNGSGGQPAVPESLVEDMLRKDPELSRLQDQLRAQKKTRDEVSALTTEESRPHFLPRIDEQIKRLTDQVETRRLEARRGIIPELEARRRSAQRESVAKLTEKIAFLEALEQQLRQEVDNLADRRAEGGRAPTATGSTLLYDGKSFEQWRAELLVELKPSVRIQAIRALSTLGAVRDGSTASADILKVMKLYYTTFDEEEGAVRAAVVSALARLGVSAVKALMDQLRAEDRNDRLFACETLREISSLADVKPAIPALLVAMEDKDAKVRAAAIESLRALPFQKPGDFVAALVKRLTDEDGSCRYLAANALGQLGETAESAVPELIRMAEDPIARLRERSVYALCSIAPGRKAVTSVLIKHLRDPDARIRESVSNYLAHMPASAVESVPVLVQSLKEVHYEDRLPLVLALGQIGPGAKEAIPALQELLDRANQFRASESGFGYSRRLIDAIGKTLASINSKR